MESENRKRLRSEWFSDVKKYIDKIESYYQYWDLNYPLIKWSKWQELANNPHFKELVNLELKVFSSGDMLLSLNEIRSPQARDLKKAIKLIDQAYKKVSLEATQVLKDIDMVKNELNQSLAAKGIKKSN
jgi:hypothetical protein